MLLTIVASICTEPCSQAVSRRYIDKGSLSSGNRLGLVYLVSEFCDPGTCFTGFSGCVNLCLLITNPILLIYPRSGGVSVCEFWEPKYMGIALRVVFVCRHIWWCPEKE